MNYKIRVKIELVESNESPEGGITNPSSGVYEQVLSQEMGENIDGCEEKFMPLMYAAMRESLGCHWSQSSKKVAEGLQGEGESLVEKEYRVDSEMGRIEFRTYYVESPEGLQGMLPPLKGKDRYKTQGYKEIGLVHGTTEKSYNKSSRLLNRMRHQEGATPARTLRDNSEAEGQALQQAMNEKAESILGAHQFTPEGMPKEDADRYREQSFQKLTKATNKVKEAIAQAAPDEEWAEKMKKNKVPYEKAEQSVALCVDDVNAKRQKEKRPPKDEIATPPQKDAPKYVHNTDVHIAQGEKNYIINGHGLPSVLKVVLAFLLHNDLLCFNLIFFVDGQRTIYSSVHKAFAWFKPFQFILDWYHLDKRCKEYLSMALKGRHIRNSVLEELMPYLWHGCVGDAITFLQNLDPSLVKNQEYLDKLITYFRRNRSAIPCYSVRKALNLPNSSNTGEKANDLIVSHRQKRNGMSWSLSGSVALATLSALVRNAEYKQWFRSADLCFRFSSAS